MAARPLLVVHADDLGLSPDVNEATVAALDAGVVTSASLMAPAPAFEDAVARTRGRGYDLGVHLTITSEWPSWRWGPVSPPSQVPSLVSPDGAFRADPFSAAREAAPDEVAAELHAQINRVVAAGLEPTHLDTHQFALLRTPTLRAVLARVAADRRLPCFDPFARRGAALGSWRRPRLEMRLAAPRPDEAPEAWVRGYCDAVGRATSGVTQIVVHCGRATPALYALTSGHSAFDAAWRQRDYDAVMSVGFRAALARGPAVRADWRACSSDDAIA